MLLPRRKYAREAPSRDAKKIFIFCEGARREPMYFSFFRELDSRIDIIIYSPGEQDNTSPGGLTGMACAKLMPSDEAEGKIELLTGDEVWLVFDKDPDKGNSREQQIRELCDYCRENQWNFAQSNPCFEVWLWYHLYPNSPLGDGLEQCSTWKNHSQMAVVGGFDPRKHPSLIGEAVRNAEGSYRETDGDPATGCTQLFRLGKRIQHLVQDKLPPGVLD